MVDPVRRAKLLRELEQDFVPDYDASNLPSADKRAAYALEHIAFRVGRIEQSLARIAAVIEVSALESVTRLLSSVARGRIEIASRGAKNVHFIPALRHHTFERLVSLLGEIGIKFTELGRLGDEILIRRLEVFALHLHGLLELLAPMSFSHAAAEPSNDFFE